jgi:two-component system, OmpR family, sensor histidine kinase QseC
VHRLRRHGSHDMEGCHGDHSLRGRLVGTLLAVFIAIWLAVGIYVCVQIAQARSGSMDDELGEIARIVLLSMPSDIGSVSSTASNLTLPSGESAHFEKLGRLSFQVWVKPRREMVVRSAESVATALKPDFRDGVETVTIAGEDWRVYAISDARNEIQVQVGEPLSALFDELQKALYFALGISFLALMLVGIALKRVVRWSLKPVVTIQSAITSRDALDLTPLPDKGLPDEVRPLVVSFNRLLSRLDGTLQAERRFFTEAAHELRTPLAVLLTHAQVAQRAKTLEEARGALDQLARGVERSTRLSQQLLDSARLNVEKYAGEQAPVELADIVAVVTHEFEIMAAQKSQSIALHTEPGIVLGNVDELGILVRNLLDNALRYAGEGAHVAVRCVPEAKFVRLQILDDGPGVAESERGRIFDRFYRGSGNSERGSGIGLALVSRIAQLHDANVITGSGLQGRGFGITVSFHAIEDAGESPEASAAGDEDAGAADLRPAPASP